MGLLAIISAMLAHLANYLFPLPFPLIFPYCWASFAVRPFVPKKIKNGPQQLYIKVSTMHVMNFYHTQYSSFANSSINKN